MITVHGYLGKISPALRDEAASADLVVGGTRHLDALGVEEGRRVVLGPIGPAIERITALGPDAEVVMVASGDPLFYGVVRRMRQAGLRARIVTAPTSIAAAFATVGLPWDDAQVVSGHGHNLRPTLNACRALPKVAVLTAPGQGIREIAGALTDVERTYVLAERLGTPDERIRVLTGNQARTVADMVEPNVVLVLAAAPDDDAMTGVHPSIAGPRRDTDPPPVGVAAAVAFTHLLPGLGELVWVDGSDLAGEVAQLSRRSQAAVAVVTDATDQLPAPDLACLEDPSKTLLARLAAAEPRRVAILTSATDTTGPGSILTGFDWRTVDLPGAAHRCYLGVAR